MFLHPDGGSQYGGSEYEESQFEDVEDLEDDETTFTQPNPQTSSAQQKRPTQDVASGPNHPRRKNNSPFITHPTSSNLFVQKNPLQTLYLPSPYAPRIKRGLISFSTLRHVPSIARVLSAVRYCSVAATSSYQFGTSIAPVIRRTREASAVIIFVFQTK
ncbi:hypothetical protein Pyn_40283 [Prunus yedoensis var. nudiflora]|uniref:Uncharacterized protein n=1 Tax=Prunus yedoensis var. nudiflora TaxID=2094558 RepID=A0A314UMW6_PRUYE|nr:hypothetical protein Pyn_40283 [Prunus yedoensis var. nudiflora]